MKVSEQMAADIEAKTRAQSAGNLWRAERQWRLSASHFGDIINVTGRRNMVEFCKSMYSPKDLSKVPAIRHGNIYEPIALEQFSAVTGKTVVRSGLCIDPELPFLGTYFSLSCRQLLFSRTKRILGLRHARALLFHLIT